MKRINPKYKTDQEIEEEMKREAQHKKGRKRYAEEMRKKNIESSVKPIINGIEYPSLKAAARKTGVKYDTLRNAYKKFLKCSRNEHTEYLIVRTKFEFKKPRKTDDPS